MSQSVVESSVSRRKRLKRRLGLLLASLAVVGVCAAVRVYWQPEEAAAQEAPRRAAETPPAKKASSTPPRAQTEQKIMAIVNGEEVTREQLAVDCVRRYGTDVLDSLINKTLIEQYCQTHNLNITRKEVDAEIERVAMRFRLPADQWLAMLQRERNISPEKYANDIIWPTLALRKAAEKMLEVTPQELQAAYETHYGPAVETRLIVCNSEEEARAVHQKAAAAPDDFAKLAKEHSVDPSSASLGGRILPIRKNLGDKRIEDAAFALREGQISDVIQVEKQWVILKCDAFIPSRMKQFPLERVRKELENAVLEKKEQIVAGQVFEKLRSKAQIVRVFGHDENSKRYPGVAAIVNRKTITVRELSDECIRRHGVEVLEGVISRRILEQACRKENIQVSQGDIDEEVARAAQAMGVVRGGKPDIDAWLEMVEKDQGLPWPRYVDEIVWPTVALKKYVKVSGGDVIVTEDDIKKGYDANWGPRVKCRAIVLNNARTAQEVWDMARKKPNAVYFGQLAYKYSVEAQTKHLNGEIPPIKHYGGKPQLEEEAFRLKANEVSGIVQVGDKYVILFCEGHTTPTAPNLADVRDDVYRDLHEKKLRLAMASAYNRMMDQARIENFLANTRQTPKTPARGDSAQAVPKSNRVPSSAQRTGVPPRRSR